MASINAVLPLEIIDEVELVAFMTIKSVDWLQDWLDAKYHI
jgi:hypothetical protein